MLVFLLAAGFAPRDGLRLPAAPGRAPRVRMAWAEPVFDSAVVRSVKQSTGKELFEVVIEANDAALDAYTTPGQFVQLRPSADAKPGFFAIASAPRKAEAGTFEFLIKRTDSTEWVCGASGQLDAQMCSPMGKGFKVEELVDADPDWACLNVVLCGAGSGIAPLRAVIEADAEDGSPLLAFGSKRTGQLFYGARSLEDMAYQDRFEAWEKRGVRVTPVLSRAEAPGAAKGYVQDAMPGKVDTPESSMFVLCGAKEMNEAIKKIATDMGVPLERLLTNF